MDELTMLGSMLGLPATNRQEILELVLTNKRWNVTNKDSRWVYAEIDRGNLKVKVDCDFSYEIEDPASSGQCKELGELLMKLELFRFANATKHLAESK